MTFLEISNNAEGGMQVESCGAGTLQDSNIHDNTGPGLVLKDTSWDVDHCAILYNGSEGVRYAGDSGGTMTYTNVKFNDLPGILVESYGSPYPQPDISYSNVYGNSLVSSVEPGTLDPSAVLDQAGTYSSGTYDSDVWSTPNGQIIIRAFLDFNESYSCTGYLQTGSGGTIVSKTSNFIDWVETDNFKTSDLRVRLYQGYSTSSNNDNRITVTSVEALVPIDPPNTIELTTGTTGGQVSANHVYWGQSTNVFERISMSRPDAVDFTSWELTEVSPCGPR